MWGPVVGLAFLGMGVVGFLMPEFVYGLFHLNRIPVPARNEARAVYGGFGMTMGYLLIMQEGTRFYPGILFTLTFALLGMAGGRVLSALIDRQFSPVPVICMCGELLGAYLLFISM